MSDYVVGWAKAWSAVPTIVEQRMRNRLVGTLRFAHPTHLVTTPRPFNSLGTSPDSPVPYIVLHRGWDTDTSTPAI